tara:strand:- start:94 stop:897 length:804 start_codon:yes stop_codon:yes gene_type:complete
MTVIRIKNDTDAVLNPQTLASGEIAYAHNTATLKVGDGTTNFAGLSSIAGGGGGGGGGVTTFIGLTDTPSSLGGASNDGKILKINSTGDGLIIAANTVSEQNNLAVDGVTWVTVPNEFISESAVTDHQGALSITESQISDLQSYLTSASSLDATKLTGNVPDANIPQSNVTQHESIISITKSQITDLPTLTDHRTVNGNYTFPTNVGNSGQAAFSDGTNNLVFESGVRSDISNTTGASGVYNIVAITQANYNSLATKDPHTVYFIPE